MPKKTKNVISMVHDGLILYYTRAAISSDCSKNSPEGIIGFYFDDLGLPQTIHRRSVWGELILRTEIKAK